MNSETFRKRALYAVETVAKFIDDFPNLYCVMRIGDKSSDADVLVGLSEAQASDVIERVANEDKD
jgi:hypothetical protein